MDCILPGSCVRGFSRLEYWSGLPFPSPGDLSQEGLNPHLLYLLHWQASSSPLANQTILKEISPGCSMEGLMLKLKLQYFGHLMRRVDSLEKTLMLGGIGGSRRRGWQRMRWLDSITYSMDMLLLLLLSRSVTSDSVRPHRRQPIRLHHPWDSPGKNTGVGFHFLLQCMKVKSLSLTQWPHGLQPTRLLRPWDFPGKSTGVGCHCLLHNGHEFEQTLGDGEGQGSLACCRPWDQKESDMIEWLNNKSIISYFKSIHLLKNLSLTKAEKLVSNSSKSNMLRFKIHI